VPSGIAEALSEQIAASFGTWALQIADGAILELLVGDPVPPPPPVQAV
jgi:hypothetical protein